MENTAIYELASGHIITLALGISRLAIAFLMLPIFSSQLVPPLVRNSFFVSLALIILSVHPPIQIGDVEGFDLFRLFAAEALIGIGIGFLFGLFLWAFDAAGELIDIAIGSSIAMIHDPISGNEVTLFGEFLGRWANYVFLMTGGLALITNVVLQSYAWWPIGQQLPAISSQSVEIFTGVFSKYFSLMLMLAAPVLLIIFLIDLSMGLINRFAQQLNVLFLSISIKSIVSIALLALLLPTITESLITQLTQQSSQTIDLIRSIFQ